MPQMAPLNWLMLLLMMISIFLLFNTLNYFSTLYYSSKNKNLNMKFKIIWKW